MHEIDDLDYYLEQLNEQVSFLVDACHSFDKGNFAQAKMMSAIIRTIVKDPKSSARRSNTVSLLKHLKKKDSMKFYNTGFEAKNAKINVNLVGIVSVPCKLPTVTKQTDNIYLPLLENSEQIDLKWLTFEHWWESKIIVAAETSTVTPTSIFTRERIVLTMAEQDGGNHVDSKAKVDKEYLELATAAKTYFNHIDPNGNKSPIIHLHFALVRQIAHELLKSLIKEFKLDIDYHPTNQYNLRGIPENNLKQPLMMVEGTSFQSTRTKKPFRLPKGQSFTTPPNAAFVRIQF